ncbi:MAG: hypothetical protein ACE5EB_06410 [Thermodesulfobacteriota bacterium]
MKRRVNFSDLARAAISAVFLLAGVTASYALDYPIRMQGTNPAYQVGNHDSHNRFCYDGSCKLDGSGKTELRLNPEKNTGETVATFKGPDGTWKITQKSSRR